MKLPGRENAYIPPAKLNDYLLSRTHPVGRSKAGFFRAAGFDETNVDVLEQRLLAIAQSEDVKDFVSSVHGAKYVIEGLLKTPAWKPRAGANGVDRRYRSRSSTFRDCVPSVNK